MASRRFNRKHPLTASVVRRWLDRYRQRTIEAIQFLDQPMKPFAVKPIRQACDAHAAAPALNLDTRHVVCFEYVR